MKKLLSLILCVWMLFSAVACGGRSASDEEDASGDSEGESVAPASQIRETAYSETMYCLYYGENLLLLKSDYDENGVLLRETFLDDNWAFYRSEYIEYEYDEDGRLISSIWYEKDSFEQYGEYFMPFVPARRLEYTHDESGRAISGVLYEDGKLTDTTAELEYYEDGTIKKRSFLEDGYLMYAMEYDSTGRCVYQTNPKKRINATLAYDGEGRDTVSAHLTYTTGTAPDLDMTFGYESGELVSAAVWQESAYEVRLGYGTGEAEGQIKTYTSERKDFFDSETVNERWDVHFVYDTEDRITMVESYVAVPAREYEDAGRTTFRYHENGLIAGVQSASIKDGSLEPEVVFLYEYDAMGNVTTKTKERCVDGGVLDGQTVWKYEYDEYGNRTKLEEYRGGNERCLVREVFWTYDSEGNEIRTEGICYHEDGSLYYRYVTDREYDRNGNRVCCISKNYDSEGVLYAESVWKCRYDERNNCIEVVRETGVDGGKKTRQRQNYDTRGHCLFVEKTVTEANGIKTVKTETWDWNDGIWLTPLYSVYDAEGNLTYRGELPPSDSATDGK